MLEKYYPIHSLQQLQHYLELYLPLIMNQLKLFELDLKSYNPMGDHLGLQVASPEEFDRVHNILISYSELINAGVIHQRRNNVYKLKNFITAHGIEIQSIEIFEPKPNADVSKLNAGIEHIALKVSNITELEKKLIENDLPISKIVEDGENKFIKTTFLNLVEIEFRNEYLWKELQKNGLNL